MRRQATPGITPRIPRASAEMNMTPLIDVLLVLLIIFMTTLNLSQQGVDVSVPEVEHPSNVTPPSASVMVEYTRDRQLSINSQPAELASLEARLREIFASRRDRTLFVRGDGALRYGEVVRIIDAARGAGGDARGNGHAGHGRRGAQPLARRASAGEALSVVGVPPPVRSTEQDHGAPVRRGEYAGRRTDVDPRRAISRIGPRLPPVLGRRSGRHQRDAQGDRQ